jgi:hypothetical protein
LSQREVLTGCFIDHHVIVADDITESESACIPWLTVGASLYCVTVVHSNLGRVSPATQTLGVDLYWRSVRKLKKFLSYRTVHAFVTGPRAELTVYQAVTVVREALETQCVGTEGLEKTERLAAVVEILLL